MKNMFSILACALLIACGVVPASGVPEPTALQACRRQYVHGVGMACINARGLLEVALADGTTLTTHGPDAKPDTAPSHGRYIRPGDEERAPVCATDYYQRVLYGYPSGATNRTTEVVPLIRSIIRRMNAVLYESSIASGGPSADYKVLCTNGEIRVDTFVGPATSTNFVDIVNAARNAGHQSSNVDYTIFFDAQDDVVCGVGSFADDDRAGVNNPNNRGGAYGVTYKDCWFGETPMHENGHNQGAVQYDAPMSDQNAHCLEMGDVMCYTNFLEIPLVFCPNVIYFDCGFDTYFDSAPEPGEWLATHWNIGSRDNRFIRFG